MPKNIRLFILWQKMEVTKNVCLASFLSQTQEQEQQQQQQQIGY
jgi:hypothetical protein